MKKSTKLFKRFFALLLVVLMSIESIGAVVSDNDGSAFITKAEFDSLKNNFQSQIDQYNSSIDSKIDGAIASYLAGVNIAKKQNLESLINGCNCKFNADWAVPTTRIGNKFRYWLHVGAMQIPNNGVVTTNVNTNMATWEAKVSNRSGTAGGWREEGDVVGKFVVCDISQVDGRRYPSYDMESIPVSAVEAYAAHFALMQINSGWNPHVSNFTVSADSINNWGMINAQIPVYTTTAENVSLTADGIAVFQNEDTRIPSIWINTLPGELYDNAQAIYFVNAQDIYTINKGSIIGYGPATTGWASMQTGNNSYSAPRSVTFTTRVANSEKYNSNQRIAAYRHVFWQGNMNSLCNQTISTILKKDVKYYEGCPLFTAPKDGNVKFKLKFVNDANATTKFDLSAGPFGNVTVVGGTVYNNVENVVSDNINPASNTEVNISFDVKKDITYWIKALPTSGITTITSVDDIVFTEE